MAGDTELGRAVIPIRATLDGLDEDLRETRGKLEGGLGSIAKGMVSVVGGVFAAGAGAAGILGSLAAEAAPLEGISASFQGITGDADAMIASLREGSAGMATDADLMKSYNSAAQLVGKTFADQLPGAMEYLRKVSAATGKDMGFMLDSLVKGVGRLSAPILDNLDIQVSMTEATALWAKEAGMAATSTINNTAAMEDMGLAIQKTEAQLLKAKEQQAGFGEETSEATKALNAVKMEELSAKLAGYRNELEGLSVAHGTTYEDLDALTESMTKAQQQEAMMMLTMAKLEENTAAMPDVLDNASTKMAQFESTMANLKAEVGMAFLPILGEVMGIFGDLAEKYGPMLADLFGRLAEMLGPLLGSALETLLPLIMELLDMVIPLAETLLTNLFPAFAAILEAVVGLAVALLSGLAPVLTAIQEALMPVIIMLADLLAPILGEIISGLLPVLVPLLKMVAGVFGRLLAALLPVIGQLLGALVPVLLEIINAILPPFISVLEVLLDVFIEYIELWLPVFADLLTALIGPVGDLAILLAEGLGKALEFLAGLIETVVQPVMDWWIRTILEPIIDIVARISLGIQSVTDWLKGLADTVRELDLPGWMTPGSPTPLELGLRGIAKEIAHVDRLMGGLNASMTMQAVPARAMGGGQWLGNVVIYGSADPQATASAVIRALQDRGMLSQTQLR